MVYATVKKNVGGWVQFDSQSGHIPRLRVQSPVGVGTVGNRSMFLSHIDVSLPFSLSKNQYAYPQMRI